MSNVYCDHSSDIAEIQNEGYDDINRTLEVVDEVNIDPESYRGHEDFIQNSLPMKGHKMFCEYCDRISQNPYIIILNNVENPNGLDFVILKENSGTYQKKDILDITNKPSSSTMHCHLPYKLEK